MEFSRPEYWSRKLFPSPGDLPNPGIELRSPTLQEDSLPAELSGNSSSFVRIYHKTYIHNLQFTYTENQAVNVYFKALCTLVHDKWIEQEKSRGETFTLWLDKWLKISFHHQFLKTPI